MKIKATFGVQSKRLFSTLMSTHHSMKNEGQSFILKSGQEFASRSEQIFQALQTLENEHETRQKQVSQVNEKSTSDTIIEDPPSVFLKPSSIPRKRKFSKSYVPQYLKHPEKWKKYSLSDVPDHTNEANTCAAMQFLSDIKKKRFDVSSSCETERQIFVTSGSKAICDDLNSCTSSRRVIMSECVVGCKKGVPKRNKKITVRQVEIQLPHLNECEEDEN